MPVIQTSKALHVRSEPNGEPGTGFFGHWFLPSQSDGIEWRIYCEIVPVRIGHRASIGLSPTVVVIR